MKKKIISLILVITLSIIVFTGCSSWNRFKKSWSSDMDGGLNRAVTVYDYNGNVLKQYSGKFDVESNESKVFFDMEDGKRIIIYNAIVINEEE